MFLQLIVFTFWEFLSCSNIKKFLIFQKTETPTKLFIFQETELSYISGEVYSELWHNGTFLYFKKGMFRTLTKRNCIIFLEMKVSNLIFQKGNFQAQKVEKIPSKKSSYISNKWNFLAPGLKNFLCFSRELAISEKSK